jgi:hypothetical protein
MTPLQQQIKAEHDTKRKLERDLERCKKRIERLEYQLAEATKLPLNGITDKWTAFERFCEAHRNDGFTRPQFMQWLTERGIKCGKNFPYQAVQKYESRFIQNGDRFFLRNAGKQSGASSPESNPRRPGKLKAEVVRLIKLYKKKITSRKIYNYLKRNHFQFWSKKPNASIANILRKLHDSGELDQTRPVDGINPAEYEMA